jgi:hypothetical protein
MPKKYKTAQERVGERFGMLIVLRVSLISPIRAKWMAACLCDCGAIASVPLTNLVSKRTKSCGCARGIQALNCTRQRLDRAFARAKEHLGEKYNRLTIRTIYHDTGSGLGIMADCACDCGAVRSAKLSRVRSGDVKACQACAPVGRQVGSRNARPSRAKGAKAAKEQNTMTPEERERWALWGKCYSSG